MARLHSRGRHSTYARLEHEPDPGGQAGLSVGELLHCSGKVRLQYRIVSAMNHCEFCAELTCSLIYLKEAMFSFG